jgi:hypothetical protein
MPGLAAIARDILCIPAAGVGLERTFNQSRDVCHYRRGRLAPLTIRAQMISNFHLRRELYNDSIESVKDTIDIDGMSTKELQEEAKYRTEHLNKALEMEYISDTDGDFLRPYKKTKAQKLPRHPANTHQHLSS